MNARTKNIVGVWFLAGVAAILIAIIPTCGHAASIAEWERQNDHCHGDQIMPDENPACKKVVREQAALLREGYVLEDHEVWVSREQFQAWRMTFLTYGYQAQRNLPDLMSIMPVMIQSMARAVPLPQLFAIWNDPDMREWARNTSPAGWAMMSEGMRQVALSKAQTYDPRFTLSGQ